MNGSMKIIRLKAENIKRLVAVEIAADGSPVVVIRGKNGAGKTSVLDSIAYALGGQRLQPAKPIRQGQQRAAVTVDLGDLVVTRTWTANEQSYLSVSAKDGAVYRSPQALLDRLVGQISFDPLTFARLDPAKQAELLRQLVGLDFRDLDARRTALYDERTIAGRALRNAEARAAGMPAIEAPTELVDVRALLTEQKRRLQEVSRNDEQGRLLASIAQEVARAADALEHLRQQVEDQHAALRLAETRYRAAIETQADAETRLNAQRDRVAGLQDPDVDAVTRQLTEAEDLNTRVRAQRQRADQLAEVEVAKTTVSALTATIETIDQEKAKALASIAYPVSGLGFDETGGLTFNGLPFEQASSAEQLRVSVGIGLAMNPMIRVLLIRDGSLLDETNLALLATLVGERDAQVWIERVDGAVGVLIEDGAVVPA